MNFERSTIFRTAHATARRARATSRAFRSYREAFAAALRCEWAWAKQHAAQAEAEAEAAITLSPDVIVRCAALRQEASHEPQTFVGHARFRALNAKADDIALAARLSMIPAKDRSHHAC